MPLLFPLLFVPFGIPVVGWVARVFPWAGVVPAFLPPAPSARVFLPLGTDADFSGPSNTMFPIQPTIPSMLHAMYAHACTMFGSDVNRYLTRDGWLYNGICYVKKCSSSFSNGPHFFGGVSPGFLNYLNNVSGADGAERGLNNVSNILNRGSYIDLTDDGDSPASLTAHLALSSAASTDGAPIPLSSVLEDVGITRDAHQPHRG